MSSLITCPPNIDQILQVIGSLYHKYDNKSESKELASKWLESIQNSVYAWEIADQLLIKKQDVESCYFAAQTLRTKLQSSFNELPQASVFALKNSILNHIKNINESVIQTQLALSITYLAILGAYALMPIQKKKDIDLNQIV
jgi:transportin-3 (transportin-SR) (TRN-SR) (importin-12).